MYCITYVYVLCVLCVLYVLCVLCVLYVLCVLCLLSVHLRTPGLLGADLMLPGVVGPDQGGGDYSTLVKGQVCGVNLAGNR